MAVRGPFLATICKFLIKQKISVKHSKYKIEIGK